MDMLAEVDARKARILAPVPADAHAQVKADAWYIQGRIGGRYTDCLSQAVQAYLAGGKINRGA